MTVQSLTLSTDKRQYLFVTPLVFRSGEKNVTVDVTLVDSNNKPYDLTDKDIYFEEQKQLHYVSDNETSSFDLTNAKNGQFIYTLNNVSLLTSGEAWFRIQSSDQSTIDTTQTFNITILDGLNLDDDKSYISALSLAIDQANGLLEDLKSITDGADGRLDTFFMDQVSKITTWKNETLNGLTATVTQNKSDVATDLDQFKLEQQNKLTDLTSQWDSLKADINKSLADAGTATAQATSTIKDVQNLLETIPNDQKYIGPQGVKGDGLKIDGSADSVDTLPADSVVGTTYLVDGSIYTYDGVKWNDCGKLQGPAGTDGIDGKDGAMGPAGVEGKSAYQVWLDNGNTGTESDYLTSLKGKDGIDGKDGTNGINGVDGKDGASAYQNWIDAGNAGTEANFLTSLIGPAGKDGKDATSTTPVFYSGKNVLKSINSPSNSDIVSNSSANGIAFSNEYSLMIVNEFVIFKICFVASRGGDNYSGNLTSFPKAALPSKPISLLGESMFHDYSATKPFLACSEITFDFSKDGVKISNMPSNYTNYVNSLLIYKLN